jgi:hypothetical protein
MTSYLLAVVSSPNYTRTPRARRILGPHRSKFYMCDQLNRVALASIWRYQYSRMVITMGLSNSFIVLDRKLLEYRSVHYRPATNFLWTERHRLLEQRDGDMAISRSTVASTRAMVITHCHRASNWAMVDVLKEMVVKMRLLARRKKKKISESSKWS